MPKDKSATNAKIISCMREEFLNNGYDKASLNRISAKVGITTAGLYKHFRSKEDMFGFLVSDALEALRSMQSENTNEMTVSDYDPFSDDVSAELIELIYEHFESWKLLVCCSVGSKYERFEENLIDFETVTNKQYAEILRKAGRNVQMLTEMEWHILSAEYIHLVLEMVRHDMTRDEAYRHLGFVKTLLYPGWKDIFGL